MDFRKGIFKCDVCGISLDSITIVNGMHFCTKCYYQTFGNMKSQEYLQLENNNKDHKIAVLERALELAVSDKCKYENLMAESIVGKGAKVAIPKKEQWYKEQAESDIKNEKE